MVKVIVQGSGGAGVTHDHLVGCARSGSGSGETVKAVAKGQSLGRRSRAKVSRELGEVRMGVQQAEAGSRPGRGRLYYTLRLTAWGTTLLSLFILPCFLGVVGNTWGAEEGNRELMPSENWLASPWWLSCCLEPAFLTS